MLLLLLLLLLLEVKGCKVRFEGLEVCDEGGFVGGDLLPNPPSLVLSQDGVPGRGPPTSAGENKGSEGDDVDLFGVDEDAVAVFCDKVPDAVDHSIVDSAGVVERDADPRSRGKGNRADVEGRAGDALDRHTGASVDGMGRREGEEGGRMVEAERVEVGVNSSC